MPGAVVVGVPVGLEDEVGSDVEVLPGTTSWCRAGVLAPPSTTRLSVVPAVLLLEMGCPIMASAAVMPASATANTPTMTAASRPRRRRDWTEGAAGVCSGPLTGRARRDAGPPAWGRSSRRRLLAVRREWA